MDDSSFTVRRIVGPMADAMRKERAGEEITEAELNVYEAFVGQLELSDFKKSFDYTPDAAESIVEEVCCRLVLQASLADIIQGENFVHLLKQLCISAEYCDEDERYTD